MAEGAPLNFRFFFGVEKNQGKGQRSAFQLQRKKKKGARE